MSAPAAGPTPAEALRRRSREALSALALQFLLGMAANLIGEPKGTFAIVVDTIIVILHIIVAIGLVVVSIRVLLAARAAGVGQRLAVWGIVVIVITFLAGVGTMVTGNEWASYLMAVGFLVAAALYGGTFFASYGLSRTSRA
jgi:protein-S-isoprenylcysteine O-methyltransferase Ste14